MKYKNKLIGFNDEMNNDIEEIKNHFFKNFKVMPSNTAIMNLLIKTYKEKNLSINKKSRSKKTFIIQL